MIPTAIECGIKIWITTYTLLYGYRHISPTSNIIFDDIFFLWYNTLKSPLIVVWWVLMVQLYVLASTVYGDHSLTWSWLPHSLPIFWENLSSNLSFFLIKYFPQCSYFPFYSSLLFRLPIATISTLWFPRYILHRSWLSMNRFVVIVACELYV